MGDRDKMNFEEVLTDIRCMGHVHGSSTLDPATMREKIEICMGQTTLTPVPPMLSQYHATRHPWAASLGPMRFAEPLAPVRPTYPH
jgi:hypothetical protein